MSPSPYGSSDKSTLKLPSSLPHGYGWMAVTKLLEASDLLRQEAEEVGIHKRPTSKLSIALHHFVHLQTLGIIICFLMEHEINGATTNIRNEELVTLSQAETLALAFSWQYTEAASGIPSCWRAWWFLCCFVNPHMILNRKLSFI